MKTQIWYRVSKYSFNIREVEVTRFTKTNIFKLERALFEGDKDSESRHARRSDHAIYFQNLECAVAHIKEKAELSKNKLVLKLAEVTSTLELLDAGKVPLLKLPPDVKIPAIEGHDILV